MRSLPDLIAAGLVAPASAAALAPVVARYAVAVTPAMAALAASEGPDGPIARQFVPEADEAVTTPAERADPIGDEVHEKVPGLIHRYPDRVLLKVTLTCPVYCRFCFRREMVGPGSTPPLAGPALDRALDYIAADPHIFEVIVTGGDPLMLSARRIAELTSRIGAIPHVEVLRWHSRVPVVDPGRVTEELIASLRHPEKAVWLAIHTNHASELTPAARDAIRRLDRAGIKLASQTVLLRGINDTAATLAALFRSLVAIGVRPYYLHHADLAPGTSHFRTTLAEGQAIIRELRGRVSGLALPTYVLDIPGGFGKVPVGPGHVDADEGVVIDSSGRRHGYPIAGSGSEDGA